MYPTSLTGTTFSYYIFSVVSEMCRKPNIKGFSKNAETLICIEWAHQGMILGPPDYEPDEKENLFFNTIISSLTFLSKIFA